MGIAITGAARVAAAAPKRREASARVEQLPTDQPLQAGKGISILLPAFFVPESDISIRLDRVLAGYRGIPHDQKVRREPRTLCRSSAAMHSHRCHPNSASSFRRITLLAGFLHDQPIGLFGVIFAERPGEVQGVREEHHR